MQDINKLNLDILTTSWEFPADSILKNYTDHTPPREIFMACCDEIAKFLTPYGFKYAASKPKLTIKHGDLTLQLIFSSSHSNMPGSYVCLELNANLYSAALAKLDKNEEYDAKGFILGSMDFTYRVQHGKPEGTVTVELMDGTISDERIENKKGATLIRNRNYNLYGLTTDNFIKVLQYINDTAIEPFLNLNNKDYFIRFINNTALGNFGRETSRLIKYVQLVHPEPADIIEAINQRVLFYKQSPR